MSYPKITVYYSTLDHFSQTRTFKTLAAARAYAVKRVGANPDIGCAYAISGDGVSKIEVSGISLAELFGFARAAERDIGEFGIFKTWNMDTYNETRLVSRHATDEGAAHALDFHSQNDHAEMYHYGATWENDRWVKWVPTYNGLTAAEIMAQTYPEGPF